MYLYEEKKSDYIDSVFQKGVEDSLVHQWYLQNDPHKPIIKEIRNGSIVVFEDSVERLDTIYESFSEMMARKHDFVKHEYKRLNFSTRYNDEFQKNVKIPFSLPETFFKPSPRDNVRDLIMLVLMFIFSTIFISNLFIAFRYFIVRMVEKYDGYILWAWICFDDSEGNIIGIRQNMLSCLMGFFLGDFFFMIMANLVEWGHF